MIPAGMMMTTCIVQLTEPPRLGTWVVPPQQQTQRNGAFFTARHFSSQPHIVRRAAPERAVQPLAPLHGATSPLRVKLGLPVRLPDFPSPTTPVELQPSASEGREAEVGEPVTTSCVTSA